MGLLVFKVIYAKNKNQKDLNYQNETKHVKKIKTHVLKFQLTLLDFQHALVCYNSYSHKVVLYIQSFTKQLDCMDRENKLIVFRNLNS